MNNSIVEEASAEQSFAAPVWDLHAHKTLWVGLDLAAFFHVPDVHGEILNISDGRTIGQRHQAARGGAMERILL